MSGVQIYGGHCKTTRQLCLIEAGVTGFESDGPTQAEYDAFIESLERHAGIRKDDSVNGPELAAAGDEKQDESHSASQPPIKSDQALGILPTEG